MKKYELGESAVFGGVTLYRVVALIDIPSAGAGVRAGDVGGWVEGEENLSHNGSAWVADNAQVYDVARVYDEALVYGDARVFNNAQVFGQARVFNNARVRGTEQEHTK